MKLKELKEKLNSLSEYDDLEVLIGGQDFDLITTIIKANFYGKEYLMLDSIEFYSNLFIKDYKVEILYGNRSNT